MLETLSKKHGTWARKIQDYNIALFTYLDQYGVLHESPIQCIDPIGRSYEQPLHFISDNGTIYNDLHLNAVPSYRQCKLIGHRCYSCRLPPRYKAQYRPPQLPIIGDNNMSKLRKQLNEIITEQAWTKKENIRLQ